jgi:hypothetical protein
MENFEKFKTFKTVDTSEDLAEATPKAYEELRKANEIAAKSFMYTRFGYTPERKVLAENEVAVVELAYKDFQEKIQNEAEKYVAGYDDYTKRFKEAATAMSIQAEPSSIDEFIWQVDRSTGDQARMFGYYKDDLGGPETYSFHASPEAQKRSIDRAIIGDLLTERVPAGSVVSLTPGEGVLTSTRDARRPRLGMDRASALDLAKEKGAPLIISSHASMLEKRPGSINHRYISSTESYFAVPPEVAALLTDEPEKNHMIPDVYGNGYWANETFFEADGRKLEFDAVYEAFPTSSIEAAENPIVLTLKIGDRETPISATFPEKIIEQMLREVEPRSGNADGRITSTDRLKMLQEARIKMPDGSEKTIMDITPELLETMRHPQDSGPEAQAA